MPQYRNYGVTKTIGLQNTATMSSIYIRTRDKSLPFSFNISVHHPMRQVIVEFYPKYQTDKFKYHQWVFNNILETIDFLNEYINEFYKLPKDEHLPNHSVGWQIDDHVYESTTTNLREIDARFHAMVHRPITSSPPDQPMTMKKIRLEGVEKHSEQILTSFS